MTYSNYSAPGVDVLIQKQDIATQSPDTQFYPIFIGQGITSRTRTIEKSGLQADVTNFPLVKLTFDLLGDINTDMFDKTTFTAAQVTVTYSSPTDPQVPTVSLDNGTGYTVDTPLSFSTTNSTASITLNISDATVTADDVIYDINITASNTDRDYSVLSVGAQDRFYSQNMFGPIVMEENDVQLYNDVAIAAEIAFRMNVPRFYYLEAARDFGSAPTAQDYSDAINKAYFYNDAYRIVCLTSDPAVASSLNQFITGVSNPIDQRETVAFTTFDTTQLTSIYDMNELEQKVGAFSESLNNKRMCNIFGASTVEMVINGVKYVLPEYFLAAAVSALDTVVGLVDPLSRREISVFSKINGPQFRPADWDKLAQHGVFIIKQDTEDSPIVIRHQLTTANSDLPEDQEYSVVKNFDVVTKKIRDRFAPYAGQNNVDAGYTDRLDGTMATVKQEILDLKLAKSLDVITPWSQSTTDGRNLVTKLQMGPVFPANNLDVYLIV